MNWNSPVADELFALRLGLKFDSTLAVASRYSKLAPVACAARWIAPATPDASELAPCCVASCRAAGDGFGWTDMDALFGRSIGARGACHESCQVLTIMVNETLTAYRQ